MKTISIEFLVKSSFAMALTAVLMSILPFILFMFSLSSEHQGPGSMGLSDIHGYMTLSLMVIPFLGSVILLLVIAVRDRKALFNVFGIATLICNSWFLLYCLFWLWVMRNDLIG